jgi:hypothetical protein
VQTQGPNSGLGSAVMVVMAMVMVLRCGKRRGGNDCQQQGNEQKFLHASHRSIAFIAPACLLQ